MAQGSSIEVEKSREGVKVRLVCAPALGERLVYSRLIGHLADDVVSGERDEQERAVDGIGILGVPGRVGR